MNTSTYLAQRLAPEKTMRITTPWSRIKKNIKKYDGGAKATHIQELSLIIVVLPTSRCMLTKSLIS